MPTPYIFTACEKAIIGKDDVVSLIALFTKIIVNIPAGTEIPKNAVVPKDWAIFSMWTLEPGDESRDCMICTEIIYPDETPFFPIPKAKMVLEANKKSQVGIQVQGFPIGQEGFYTVRTWVEEGEKTIAGPIEFKLEVQINRQLPVQKAAANEANEETRAKS
jgi:hypothetical protein